MGRDLDSKCAGRRAAVVWMSDCKQLVGMSEGFILSKVSVEIRICSYVFPESVALSRSSWPVRACVVFCFLKKGGTNRSRAAPEAGPPVEMLGFEQGVGRRVSF